MGVGNLDATDRRLESFVADEGQALLRFAFLLTGGNPTLAEDLVQSVLARLVARGIDDLADARTYTRRAIVNEYRGTGRRAQVHRRAMTRVGPPPETAEQPHSVEDRDAVLTALRELSDRERAAVVLRYYVDLGDDQIAEALGCAQPTVRSLVRRGLRKLRPRLEPILPTAEEPS